MKRLLIVAGTTGMLVAGASAAYAYTGGDSGTPTPPAPAAPSGPPALGQLLYGEAATTDGLRDWQHGTVSSVASTALTVRSSDGTSWTWTVDGSTKVGAIMPFGIENKGATSISGIKAGDSVMVAGTRSGNTRTATRVVDPPPDFSKIRQRLEKLRTDLKRDLSG